MKIGSRRRGWSPHSSRARNSRCRSAAARCTGRCPRLSGNTNTPWSSATTPRCPRVTRQARMTKRMDVAGDDRLSNRKRGATSSSAFAPGSPQGRLARLRPRSPPAHASGRLVEARPRARGQLVAARDQALLVEQLSARTASARSKRSRGTRLAACVRARHRVDVAEPPRKRRHRERENAAFPLRMEDRFVGFGNHRPEAMHAAEIVNAVHPVTCGHLHHGGADHGIPCDERRKLLLGSCPPCQRGAEEAPGSAGRQCESQTRTSTSPGTSTPNSRSTPRGSITARDR